MIKDHNPRITCRDGFTMSVQASEFSYCHPREDHPSEPYTHVECGFPNSEPVTKELRDYAECFGDNGYTETVYGYTPVEVVQAELDAHGGIVEGKLPV